MENFVGFTNRNRLSTKLVIVLVSILIYPLYVRYIDWVFSLKLTKALIEGVRGFLTYFIIVEESKLYVLNY